MPQLEDAFRYGYWQHFVYPIDVVLLPWAAIVVNETTASAIRNGRPFADRTGYLEQHALISSSSENRCRAYTHDGCFLGVLWFNPERGLWQPEKVFL